LKNDVARFSDQDRAAEVTVAYVGFDVVIELGERWLRQGASGAEEYEQQAEDQRGLS